MSGVAGFLLAVTSTVEDGQAWAEKSSPPTVWLENVRRPLPTRIENSNLLVDAAALAGQLGYEVKLDPKRHPKVLYICREDICLKPLSLKNVPHLDPK